MHQVWLEALGGGLSAECTQARIVILAAQFLAFGIACLVIGVIMGRVSKRTRKVVEIVGYERDPKGRFKKAIER